MIVQHNDQFKDAFETLKDGTLPTAYQKGKMLNQILLESRLYEDSKFDILRRLISVYPWRFAFGVSSVQAVIFTLMFGTQYTNLFLGFFGG